MLELVLHWAPCTCFIISLHKLHQGKCPEELLLGLFLSGIVTGKYKSSVKHSLTGLGSWLSGSSACQASVRMSKLVGYGCPHVITVHRHRQGSPGMMWVTSLRGPASVKKMENDCRRHPMQPLASTYTYVHLHLYTDVLIHIHTMFKKHKFSSKAISEWMDTL